MSQRARVAYTLISLIILSTPTLLVVAGPCTIYLNEPWTVHVAAAALPPKPDLMGVAYYDSTSQRQYTLNLLPYSGVVEGTIPLVGTPQNRYPTAIVDDFWMSPDLWAISPNDSQGEVAMYAGDVANGGVSVQVDFPKVYTVGQGYPVGYPSLSYGMAMFGGAVTKYSPIFPLPTKLDDLTALNLTVNYSVQPNNVPIDFGYDIWITHTVEAYTTSEDLEIMLWLYRQEVSLLGSQKLGSFETAGSLNNTPTNITWEAYLYPRGGTSAPELICTISSVGSNTDLRHAEISFDFTEIFSRVDSMLEPLGYPISSSFYLEQLDIGSEFWPIHNQANYTWSIYQYSFTVSYNPTNTTATSSNTPTTVQTTTTPHNTQPAPTYTTQAANPNTVKNIIIAIMILAAAITLSTILAKKKWYEKCFP